MQNFKESKIIFLVFIISGVVFWSMYFLAPKPNIPNIPMPWNATKISNTTQVFGLKIGENTLKNAMQIFGSEAEVALFKNKNKENTVEVYFNNTKIGGLSVRIILALILTNDDLKMLNQNIDSHEVLPSGSEKVEFRTFALNKLLDKKIKHLSFIPRVSLEEKVILARFGEPEIREKNKWIYPKQGLQVVRDGDLSIFEYK